MSKRTIGEEILASGQASSAASKADRVREKDVRAGFRQKSGLSQSAFAAVLDVILRTLRTGSRAEGRRTAPTAAVSTSGRPDRDEDPTCAAIVRIHRFEGS